MANIRINQNQTFSAKGLTKAYKKVGSEMKKFFGSIWKKITLKYLISEPLLMNKRFESAFHYRIVIASHLLINSFLLSFFAHAKWTWKYSKCGYWEEKEKKNLIIMSNNVYIPIPISFYSVYEDVLAVSTSLKLFHIFFSILNANKTRFNLIWIFS